MKSKKTLGFASLATAALFAAIAFGDEPQKAVLNVRQNGLGIDDGLDFDAPTTDLNVDDAGFGVATDDDAGFGAADEVAAPLNDDDGESFGIDDPLDGDLDALIGDDDPVAAAPVPAEPDPEEEPVVAEAVPEADDALPEEEPVVAEAVPADDLDVLADAEDVLGGADAVPGLDEEVVAEAAPAPAPAADDDVELNAILAGDVAEPAIDAEPLAPAEEIPFEIAPIEGDGVIADDEPELLVEPVVALDAADAVPVAEPVDAGEPFNLDEPVEQTPAVAADAAPWGGEADTPAAVADEPAAVDPVSRDISEIEKLEELRRKLFINHGRDCLRQADEALSFGNWDRAIELYNSALEYLIDMESTHADRNAANAGLGEAHYRKGLALMDMKNFSEAEKLFIEARRYSQYSEDPNFGHKLDSQIEQARKFQLAPPPEPPPPHVARWNDPDYRKAQEDIRRRIVQAREYYATGEYTASRREVELILHEYPWCEDALFLLRKLARRESRFIDEERRTTRDRMIRDVGKTWTPNTYAIEFLSGGEELVINGGDKKDPAGPGLTSEMRIREKMERIMIPEVDFRQANINDVITFLSDASRENDDDESVAVEQRGVNFVLDLGETAAGDFGGAAPASDDPWGTPEAAPASPSGVPLLTIKSYHISLAETLNMVVDMAGLKYRVQGNVVMIMPKNKAEGDLVHRMYNVLPSIGERITAIGSSAAGSGNDNDPFAVSSGEVKQTTDWKEFFGKLGVNWPDESSVTYLPQIGKLIVKNTADNLATLERVLGALNVTPYQVEIEVRFVEVGQTDINSLGLEWILGDDFEIMHARSDEGLPQQAQRRIVMEAGNINGGFNYLTGNNRETVNNGSPISDNIARFSSILTNPQLSVVLHALANRTNADLLSAPKVVAMNGNKATIKSVVEFIYPTEYDVEMLESNNSNNDSTTYTGAVVEPQSFSTREVGVILEVTPRVSPDGSRIGLDLTPSVVSIPTWKNYGSTYPVFNADGSEDYVQLNMEQPFFPVRSLATTVEIYNGSTVVMGGMITEERYAEEDKIPILGDIPLLGRLFRYQYEQSEKKNLLIFVSARLVDPAGREVSGSGTGLVETTEALALQ